MRRRLDPYSGRPLYRQAADDIRDAISAGRLRPGETLPTEAQLSTDYGIGVDAVRDALAVLRGEGLIVTERGKGSQVRLTPQVTVVKIPPGTQIRARMPDEEERRRLGIPEGVPVIVVERAGAEDVLPADRVSLETVEDEDAD